MTYNVFGGTLNPTLLYSTRLIVTFHFHVTTLGKMMICTNVPMSPSSII